MNGSFISEAGIAVIIALVLLPVLIFAFTRNIKSRGFKNSLVDNLAIVYFTIVYVLLLFPFNLILHQTRTDIAINWIPFQDIIDFFRYNTTWLWRAVAKDFFGNLFIFVPAGVFFYLKKYSNKKVVLLFVLLGLSGEVPQLILSYLLGFQYRIIDVTDVILNALGAVLGYLVAKALKLSLRNCNS